MIRILIGAGLALVAVDASAGPLVPVLAAVTSFLGPVGTAAAAGAVGSMAASKLMSSKAPKLASPTAMPTPDDEAMRATKRRQIAEMQARGSRVSTVLTDDEKLGG